MKKTENKKTENEDNDNNENDNERKIRIKIDKDLIEKNKLMREQGYLIGWG
jgi:hypothetical protein